MQERCFNSFNINNNSIQFELGRFAIAEHSITDQCIVIDLFAI